MPEFFKRLEPSEWLIVVAITILVVANAGISVEKFLMKRRSLRDAKKAKK